MTVKPSPPYWQPDLLSVRPDKPLSTNGEARTRYGAVVEEIVRSLAGLTDIPNSGNHDIVFDAHHPSGVFCEIKSLREKNKLPIYEWRRMKDRECGVPLVYLVAVHRCTRQQTLGDVWETMARTLHDVFVVPAWWIDLTARKYELRQLVKHAPGSRQGYRRKGYCNGYRNIPFTDFGLSTYHPPVMQTAEVYGLSIAASLHFHISLDPWEK